MASNTLQRQMATLRHTQSYCIVKAQEIDPAFRVAGQACPYCGVALPAKRRSVQVQSVDSGLRDFISSSPASKPSSSTMGCGGCFLAVLAGVVVAFIGLVAIFSGDSDGSGGVPSAVSVTTHDATAEVDTKLLGPSWTGFGDYTILAARKAYSSSDDFTAFAARLDASGVSDLCLYWWLGGRNFGDGLLIGDTVTRGFSDWGAAATADSPAARLVRESKLTSVGQSVVNQVGC